MLFRVPNSDVQFIGCWVDVLEMQFEMCRFPVERSLSLIQPFHAHGKSWSVKAIAHCSAVVYDGEYGSHFGGPLIKKNSKYRGRMAFWSSYFHRSDADDSLARTLRGIRENVVATQVVLGNETTENSLVHDVNVLKSKVERDKEDDRQWVSRMDSVKTASDHLKEEVETVRKMKGPKGEQGDRGPKGDRGSAGTQGERGLKGEMGEQGPSDPFYLLPYIAQNA